MIQNRKLVIVPFLVIGLVAGSFLGSSLYVERRTAELSRGARDIIEAAAPRLARLTDMRIEIHRVVTYGQSDGRGASPEVRARIVEEAEANFERAFAGYAELRSYEGSSPISEELAATIPPLREKTLAALASGAASRTGLPSAGTLEALQDQGERTTRLIMQSMSRDAADANQARQQLEEVGARTTRLSHLLYAICSGLAILGAWLAWRAMQRYRVLSDRYVRLQAERAAELEQFSGRVAHDILGPLQPVGLGLHRLSALVGDEPEAKRILERTERSLGRVQRIVDMLLEFARSGAHPGTIEPSSLDRVLQGVREDLSPVAEEAGVELRFEGAPAVKVACPEAAVTVVLQNLIRNAIKYIGDGGRKQVVTRAAVIPGAVHLEVQDTGPGLPDGLEQRVFEPYVRAPGVEQMPGIGLGLATVKRIVEAHGGKVGVLSQPGKGAAFWVDLPLGA